MIDGATRLEAFAMISLPQALPGLIVTFIFGFTLCWNEYLFASILLYSPANQTLSAGLAAALIGEYSTYSWGILMAAMTLSTLPILVLFVALQRRLVGGLTSGAIRG
jgi:ABC-type glycerol-3-phosphate transport system permease component